jgi:hypothetical protein
VDAAGVKPKAMGYHQLSRRVNKMGFFKFVYIMDRGAMKSGSESLKCIKIKHLQYVSHFVYDHEGLRYQRLNNGQQ